MVKWSLPKMQGILCSILTYGYHWCIGTNAKLSKVRYKFAKKVLMQRIGS